MVHAGSPNLVDPCSEGRDEELALRAALGHRFRLVRHLGRGGMGTVYEAFDALHERRCALKVLARGETNRRALVRFKREFRTAARLSHPSCIRVFELGKTSTYWWFTMELLTHGSLAQRLTLGQLSVLEAVRMARRVLSALDHLHGRGIVHRDLKPANILLADQDLFDLRLADLGVAQVAGLEEELGSATIVGSPRYLAPEVAERGTTDPRADLYALGVILHEALTGEHPMGLSRRATVSDWLRAVHVHEGRNIPARTALSLVPSPIAEAIRRLLAHDPDERYRTAAEVYWDLDAWYRDAESLPDRGDEGALASRPYLAATRIVGRHEELTASAAFFEASLFEPGPQTPLLLSVSGGAGSGKSRLIRGLVQGLRARDVLVLQGECREEVGTPYRELRSIFAGLAASTATSGEQDPTVSFDTRFSTPHETASELSERRADVTDLPGDFARRQLDRAVHLLADAAARGPVVIVIEDLQWIDVASLQLLTLWLRSAAVARRQGGLLPVAFVVVHRPTELRAFYDVAGELGILQTLTLQPLRDGNVGELVSSLLGVSPRVSQVFSRSIFGSAERTPLFVKQILQILLARGLLWPDGKPWLGEWTLEPSLYRDVELPKTLQEAIGDRAARLSVETQRVLGMAAVGGRRFDMTVLAHALHEDESLLLDCLDEAARAGFVLASSDSESQYLFAHDRYRESIYQHVSLDTRREHHRAWASALLVCAPGSVDVSAELAHHFALGHDHERARHHAVIAGEAAFTAGAFDQAAQMYRIARAAAAARNVALAPFLVERQGDACMNAGLYEEAATCYADRLAACEPAERPPVLVKVAELRYRAAKERGLDTESVLTSIEEATKELGFVRPRSRVGLQAATAASLLTLVGFGFVPRLMQKTAREDAPQLSALCSISVLAAEVAYFFNPSYHVFYILKAATLAARLGPAGSSSVAMGAAAFGMAQVGLENIAREFEQWSAAYESNAMTAPDRAWARLLRGISAYARGDLPAAERHMRSGCAAVERSSEPLRRAFVQSVLAFLLAERGELRESDAIARSMVQSGEVEGMSYLRFCGHSVASVVAFMDGNYTRACSDIAGCYEVEEAIRDDFSRFTTDLQQKTYMLLADTSTDPWSCLVTAAAYQKHDFASAHVSFLTHALVSVFLASAARGRLDTVLLRELERCQSTEYRKIRFRFKQQRPLLLALGAALLAVRGRRGAAERAFERARHEARTLGVLGDLRPVARLERAAAIAGVDRVAS